ncbi:MerR family DNA-binding transcriptional regulator [Companilactobacillus muriivasis]|uniref:MerR family DNA-binding transcriptional regulator n=1 Tax=Companilactobacillus muriivasis TaxID=3081444 RepID=UPI0030C6E80F
MDKFLFTIGNMSKFTGVPIKSLRYYENIGILIPEYIDPKTKYRYYSYQQIPAVMAMKFCVELGIPLKNFNNYQNIVSGNLNYEELLNDGKKILEEKNTELDKITRYIGTSMDEMNRSKTQKKGKIFKRDVKSVNAILKLETSDSQRLHNISLLIEEAKTKGLETGFDFGNCSFYNKGESDYYTYLVMNTNPSNSEQFYFPKGLYSCIIDRNITLKDAPTLFPDIYKTNDKVLAISSEILSSKFELKSPLIELRVIGLNNKKK